MPGKKPKASAPSGKTKADLTTDKLCAVCTNGIPASEVATCDECKKTSHRYCAGVPLEEFVSSDGAFTCLSCLKTLYKKQQVMTETMSDGISALKVEINELRSALKDIEPAVSVSTDRDQESEPIATQERSASDRQWTTVGSGRRGRKRHQKFTKAGLPAGSAPSSFRSDGRRFDAVALPAETNIRNSTTDKEKVIIEGKGKVWGTLTATSARAVKNTVKAPSKIEGTFEVK